MRNTDVVCKNCVFAIYSDDNITQTGCHCNMIDKFQKQYPDKFIECYDHEKEFFVVKNASCPYYKEQGWKDNLTIEEKINYIKNNTKLKFHLIIFNNNTLKDIKTTIRSINNQKLLPAYVTFIQPFDSAIIPQKVINELKRCNFKWSLQQLVDERNKYNLITSLLNMHKYPYYMIGYAGYKLHPDMLYNFNHRVVNELEQIHMVRPDKDNNGFITSYIMHTFLHVNGDPNKTVQENIEANSNKIIDVDELRELCYK